MKWHKPSLPKYSHHTPTKQPLSDQTESVYPPLKTLISLAKVHTRTAGASKAPPPRWGHLHSRASPPPPACGSSGTGRNVHPFPWKPKDRWSIRKGGGSEKTIFTRADFPTLRYVWRRPSEREFFFVPIWAFLGTIWTHLTGETVARLPLFLFVFPEVSDLNRRGITRPKLPVLEWDDLMGIAGLIASTSRI